MVTAADRPRTSLPQHLVELMLQNGITTRAWQRFHDVDHIHRPFIFLLRTLGNVSLIVAACVSVLVHRNE